MTFMQVILEIVKWGFSLHLSLSNVNTGEPTYMCISYVYLCFHVMLNSYTKQGPFVGSLPQLVLETKIFKQLSF